MAINTKRTSQALAQLSDGIGQAADDMLPGSAFLRQINSRPRARRTSATTSSPAIAV